MKKKVMVNKKLSKEEKGRRISSGRKGISAGPRPHLIKMNKSKKKREEVSKRMLGSKHSEETKKKIGLRHKGKKVSKETRRKISDSRRNRVGSLGSNWKGGRSQVTYQVRNCFLYRLWESDVLTRDGHICQFCDSKDKLETHHIKAVSDMLTEYKINSIEEALECLELWNINNGVTLCYECHKKQDKYRY